MSKYVRLMLVFGGFIASVENYASVQVGDSADKISFFVLVKSSNYAQDSTGNLKLLNYHFFSEVFPTNLGVKIEGWLERKGEGSIRLEYKPRKNNYYFEGGHFDSVEEVDAKYPNGIYQFSIFADSHAIETKELSLLGPDGRTDIPAPIHIYLQQDNKDISPVEIDPSQSLTISWSEYSNGHDDPNGIVNDMIFVVLQDCRGDRIVHTGLPFGEEPYMSYRTRSVEVPAGNLKAGEPYSIFVEFPHVVDSTMVNEVPGFTSFATATYLDLQAKGEATSGSCLAEMPPMDTGQTDR